MAADSESVAAFRVKHLEMVQAIIARVAGHGASLKNFCITLVTAVCGFSITLNRPLISVLAFFSVLTFALLDAQYLRIERRFRALFDKIRCGDWTVPTNFDVDLNSAPKIGYWSVMLSWSILSFYVPLAVGVSIVAYTLGISHGWKL